ncbi:hypothetical protein O181_002786 [Austropuccinia psidii MF-1]|uniref:Integrase catalytic domain-containing protein n=1 Tax=Austropuccinia psidii MF-1 TaxID=1389203 RepID=A0A9Q3BDM4_9BASI|nr:hypothetical protein [Austropuccinia psidii MF-1]
MKMSNSDVYSVVLKDPDRNLTIGKPSDSYLHQPIKTQNLSGEYTRSKDCEITPSDQKVQQYILVLIDDYSRFNQIFVIERNNEAESSIKSFLNKIRIKLKIIPAFLHTDCGGEFSSKNFLSELRNKGICLEQGPPNSPETNGVSKCFNQTLLTKMRCLLGKLKILRSYWDEAGNHASLLLNHLPHWFLNMSTPMMLRKPEIFLPREKHKTLKLILQKYRKENTIIEENIPEKGRFIEAEVDDKASVPMAEPSSHQERELNKNYEYASFYDKPPKDITSTANKQNIVDGKRNRQVPDQFYLTDVVPYFEAISKP